jgi:hypothetical protein
MRPPLHLQPINRLSQQRDIADELAHAYRLRGGDDFAVEGATQPEGGDLLDEVQTEAPPAPAPRPTKQVSDEQKLAMLGYSQADIIKIAPERKATIVKMNIRRPQGGIPPQWCGTSARGKAPRSKSSARGGKNFVGASKLFGATALLGALAKVTLRPSKGNSILIDGPEEYWLDQQYDKMVDSILNFFGRFR